MRPGDEWIVWIPPALGYGDRASETIPPNSILRFKLALHSDRAIGTTGSSMRAPQKFLISQR